MMPAVQYQILGGSLVMLFSCDGCGAPASFGIDVDVLAALATGNMSKAGRWGCGYRDGEPVCMVNPEAFAKPAQIIPDQFYAVAPKPDLFGGAS